MGERAETKKVEWRCHVCAANDLPCTGKALPRYKVDRLPVCKVGATYDFNEKRQRNFDIIVKLGRRAKGETKAAIEAILNGLRIEVAEIFTGSSEPGGKGSIIKALDKIADLLADARFILAAAIFEVAKKAFDEHKEELDKTKLSAVESALQTTESYLQEQDTQPTTFRDRKARWGAAKEALNLVDGLPSTIGRLSGISVRSFRAKILSRALGVSPEEAEQIMQEVIKARGESGAELEDGGGEKLPPPVRKTEQPPKRNTSSKRERKKAERSTKPVRDEGRSGSRSQGRREAIVQNMLD